MKILKILILMNLFVKNTFQYWVLINHLLIKKRLCGLAWIA